MSNVQTFMFEKALFYEIRNSVESLAYTKSVMFFHICPLVAGKLSLTSNQNEKLFNKNPCKFLDYWYIIIKEKYKGFFIFEVKIFSG